MILKLHDSKIAKLNTTDFYTSFSQNRLKTRDQHKIIQNSQYLIPAKILTIQKLQN